MKLNTIALLVSGILISGTAAAESFTAHGRVIHSTPVYKTIQIERENHRCRKNSRAESGYSNSGQRLRLDIDSIKTLEISQLNTPGISIKHTRHRKQNGENRHKPDRHHYGSDRCDSRRHYKTKRILKGFDVTYRYKGDTFHTFTKRNPGHRITLNISISPQY